MTATIIAAMAGLVALVAAWLHGSRTGVRRQADASQAQVARVAAVVQQELAKVDTGAAVARAVEDARIDEIQGGDASVVDLLKRHL